MMLKAAPEPTEPVVPENEWACAPPVWAFSQYPAPDPQLSRYSFDEAEASVLMKFWPADCTVSELFTTSM